MTELLNVGATRSGFLFEQVGCQPLADVSRNRNGFARVLVEIDHSGRCRGAQLIVLPGFLADEHGGRANAQHKGANVNGATKEDLAEVFDLYFSQNQTDIFCFKAGIEDAEDAFATFEKPYW